MKGIPAKGEIIRMLDDVMLLLDKKNEKYGDSWRELGTLGIVYRIKDKCNRIINMTINGQVREVNEDIYDLIGYSILLLINENQIKRRW